ncbi:MAG: hypothetical protein CW691_11790 [Candidatus Bathyarchaeum sp.]|nr:MAG: hypothetical protein CW691_11790 [Candidatus Bathyarchaeum sp.]
MTIEPNRIPTLFSHILIITILVGGLVQGTTMNVSAQTSGMVVVINSDTTWTKANSPYDLTGPLFISAGATLTIEAGVSVNLNNYDVLVNGTLRALGSSSDKIYVISNDETIEFSEYSNGWDEQTQSGCIIDNAILESVNLRIGVSIKIVNSYVSCPIDVGESSIIQNSTISTLSILGGSVLVKNNKIDLIKKCYGTPEISNNTIDELGSDAYGTSPVISGNTIRTIGGYKVEGSTVSIKYLTLNSPIIKNNIIKEGIYLVTGSSTIIANNTITGYLLKYTYSVYTYPLGSTEQRDATFRTSGIDLVGKGSKVKDKIYISGNVISGCSTGIRAGNPGYPIKGEGVQIENNFISNSSYSGIDVTAQAIIQNNSIRNNPTAIIVRKSSSATINYNNIENYADYSIFLEETSTSVDATNNWWGTTDTQTINTTIRDFKHDFNLGKVSFSPFLTEPNPEKMLIPELPSWMILPLFLVTTLAVVSFRKRIMCRGYTR